jgi:hypothetical protein
LPAASSFPATRRAGASRRAAADDIVTPDRRLQVPSPSRCRRGGAAGPSRLAAAEPKDTLRRQDTRPGSRRQLALPTGRWPFSSRGCTKDGSTPTICNCLPTPRKRLAGVIPAVPSSPEAIEAALVRDPRRSPGGLLRRPTLARIHRMRGDIRDYRAAVARAFATAAVPSRCEILG